MPETGAETPLDLSLFDDLNPATSEPESAHAVTVAPSETAVTDPRLAPEPPPPRLVEVAKLSPDELAAAEQAAARVNFHDTASLLSHGDGVLAKIAQSSRQLLTGVRLGDAGEIGNIAAAVIDGVKILRIEDLRAEADGGHPGARKGLLGRLLGSVADAHTAFKAGLASAGRNVELENFTSAMYEAREIAVERMQAEAAAAHAEGVVGVDIHEGSHVWKSHVIEFFAIGTAVVPLEQEIAPERIADPMLVLSVND